MNEHFTCPVLTAHSHEVVARSPDGKQEWRVWYTSEDGRPKTWGGPLLLEWDYTDRCLGIRADANP